MNEINIWAPRWKDRTVLIAEWKIAKGVDTMNKVVISAKRADKSLFYPEPFLVTSEQLQKYPIELVNGKKMRAVKLDDLLNGETL